MPMTLTEDPIEARVRIVDEHLRAENDHDVDGIMRTFGDDPTFVLNGDTISGQDDIRAFYEAFGFGGGGGRFVFHQLSTHSQEARHRSGLQSPALQFFIPQAQTSGRHRPRLEFETCR